MNESFDKDDQAYNARHTLDVNKGICDEIAWYKNANFYSFTNTYHSEPNDHSILTINSKIMNREEIYFFIRFHSFYKYIPICIFSAGHYYFFCFIYKVLDCHSNLRRRLAIAPFSVCLFTSPTGIRTYFCFLR